MLRKVKLYGELAEFIGHKEFEVQVDSLSKAVSFLVNNFPQIEKYMNPKYYQVKVGNYAVNEEEIHHPIGQEDIHIVPVISGAGSGTGKICISSCPIG
jgi:predicted phage tail protein